MPLRRPSPPLDSKAGPFVAIDFETADYGADSAMVRVENGDVVERVVSLIRPPRPRVLFTHIHGITWKMVANLPVFAEVWPTVKGIVDGAHFLAAHNASFDRKVLLTCCAAAGLVAPTLPFLCTVRVARQRWG